ncbi:hypothetical protein [Vibrio phage BONAISHI]|nr:hypothetical protein [Vibrio phage BONAISHI]
MIDKILARVRGDVLTTHDVNAAYTEIDMVFIDGNGIYSCIKDVPENSNVSLSDTEYWKQLWTGGNSPGGPVSDATYYKSHDPTQDYQKGDEIFLASGFYRAKSDVPGASNAALTDPTYWENFYDPQTGLWILEVSDDGYLELTTSGEDIDKYIVDEDGYLTLVL